MSTPIDFDAVDHLTAGAVGEPGARTFYVQAAAAGTLVTLLAEKEQVRLLGEAVEQLLSRLPEGEEGAAPDPERLDLVPPLDPEWRVGEMTLEFDESANRVVVVFRELLEEDDAGDPASARFVATRAQARAMATHALQVVAAGRPQCQLCGLPVEADGDHLCPASNGHRAPPS